MYKEKTDQKTIHIHKNNWLCYMESCDKTSRMVTCCPVQLTADNTEKNITR